MQKHKATTVVFSQVPHASQDNGNRTQCKTIKKAQSLSGIKGTACTFCLVHSLKYCLDKHVSAQTGELDIKYPTSSIV